MSKEKSFLSGEESIRSLETIEPFISAIKKGIMFWFWSNIWFFGGAILVLTIAIYEFVSLACGVGIFWFFVWLFLYFKGNGRNGRLFGIFKEWENIKDMNLLARHYQNLKNFLCLLIFLDALLVTWPITFLFKFIYWILYRVFRRKIKILRKMIIRGDLVLEPTEEELFNDPFYRFLMQEGLYEESVEVSQTGKLSELEKDSNEIINENNIEHEKQDKG